MGRLGQARGMRTENAEQLVEMLLRWLNRRLAPEGVVIDADTQLFEGGLIDSMRVLELIAWIELTTGRVIPDERIRMDDFCSARRIAERFAAE
jgi:acyl carrier protein